jgi:hypothetical protein
MPCNSCGGRHNLFVATLISPHDSYAFICPKTGQKTIAKPDQISRIVAAKPDGSLSAILHGR